jgi:hypothetical protein
MTIFELAVAREVHRLLEERKTRALTRGEAMFLEAADPLIVRLKYQETLLDTPTAKAGGF